MSKIKTYIFVLMLFLVSCDLFVTRDPEDPILSRNSFQTPLTPEILFQNLTNSFTQKNTESYNACFAEESFFSIPFNFIPSSAAAAADPALLNWNMEKEKQYFFNLIKSGENNSFSLKLLNEEWNSLENKRVYKYDYEININSQSENKFYAGTSQFEIYLDSRDYWVIVEWRDIQTSDNSTWSDLKGAYY